MDLILARGGRGPKSREFSRRHLCVVPWSCSRASARPREAPASPATGPAPGKKMRDFEL